jgi:hypothetical protein
MHKRKNFFFVKLRLKTSVLENNRQEGLHFVFFFYKKIQANTCIKKHFYIRNNQSFYIYVNIIIIQ